MSSDLLASVVNEGVSRDTSSVLIPCDSTDDVLVLFLGTTKRIKQVIKERNPFFEKRYTLSTKWF